MRKERVLGVLLTVLSAGVLAMALYFPPQEVDATAVLFTLPLGVYLLITKEEAVTRSREPPGEKGQIIHIHSRERKELQHGKETDR